MDSLQKIKNILWPNDLSKCSEAALPHVLTMAQEYGAAVHLLYVVEDLSQNDSMYGKFDVSHVNKRIEWEIKKAGEHQQKFCRNYLEGIVGYSKKIQLADLYLSFDDDFNWHILLLFISQHEECAYFSAFAPFLAISTTS